MTLIVVIPFFSALAHVDQPFAYYFFFLVNFLILFFFLLNL